MALKTNYTPAALFIIIVVAIYISFSTLMPGKITNLNTPKTEFSTERALIHLKEITKKPHYVGTEDHNEVRNYIITELEKLGLTVNVQTQIAFNRKWRAGTNTKNILARIKGTESGKALMLLTHYDSAVHSSYGASDAGSGVVTILEGIRAYLASNPKPKNDIIILISDAEEIGLLGANAFVNHHPWAKDVGLVLNFEARGSGGPSYMLMETNGGNKNLVKAFNNANTKFPVGNSLLYSIYKMLPNDTDLTVFREDGNINGYNFAFLDDHYDYHTAQDTYERLDRNTLQHQAEYLMPLLHYFADTNLENLNAEEDYVFFNFPGFDLVNYPFSWVMPMLILTTILFFILIFFGFKRNILSLKGILTGFVPFLISIVIAGSFVFYGWKLLLKVYPQYNDILQGFTYNGHFYITAFIAISIAVSFWGYSKYFGKYTIEDLSVAPIFIWLAINLGIALYLPGAGFLIIPVIVALVILAIQIFSNEKAPKKVLLYSFLIVPILMIFSPMIQMFPIGLGLKMSVISTVFTILVFGIMLPVLSAFENTKKLGNLFFLIFILSIISAAFSSGFNEERKQPNSIVYVFDAGQNQSYWASYNTKVDEFTQQFLGNDPNKGSFTKEITASKYGTTYKLFKKAEVIDLLQPEILISKDTVNENERSIHLKIIPKRKVNRIELISKNPIHFKEFSMNGESLKPKDGENYVFDTEKRKHILSYYFTDNNEYLDIKFKIPLEEIPELEIFEVSFDLYTNKKINAIKDIIPRNKIMMPMPFVLNDAVMIKKSIDLN
ncbi:MAG: M28 family peptidase [Bacteroidota bacterium]